MNHKLSCLLVFVICAWASVAFAEPRAVVRDFDGLNGKRVRAAVVSELEDHNVALVASSGADKIATQQQLDLDTDAGRVGVARELQATSFVEGKIERAGAKLRVVITVYGGSDGAQIAQLKLTATKANVVRAVKDRFWDAAGSAIEQAEAPEKKPVETAEVVAPEPEAKEPEPVVEQEPVEDEAAFEPKHSPLDISIGARFGNRDFAYKGALVVSGLRDYKLGFSPHVALHLHWYPGAHVTDGFIANLGLDLRGEVLVGVKSKNSAGTEFSTSSTRLGVGLRLRAPLGKNELGFMLGYAMHSFSFDSAKGIDPGVPGVSHGSLRLGADARWVFAEPFSLQLSAAYLHSLAPGELASSAWFPHTSGGGLEAELGFGFAVISALELQLALEVQRYFFSLSPDPADASVLTSRRVAGGALDQFMSLRASVVWRM